MRVHPEILDRQRLPASLLSRRVWDERYEDIKAFERHLARNGTRILKFFLHVSKEEQARRLRKRLNDPDKHWKFQAGDLAERKLWKRYMRAYEQALSRTSAAHAPWYVVPADRKWFTRLVVAKVLVDALDALDLTLPKLSPAQRKELAAARRLL